MSDDQRLHLQFIQGVITRMNANSTSMKGWMIAIVSALFALYANSGNPRYIWVAIAPVVLFWLFDTYYLRLEHQYRILYNKVINNDPSVTLYDMNVRKECVSFFNTLVRPVEIGIYLPIICGLVIFALLA